LLVLFGAAAVGVCGCATPVVELKYIQPAKPPAATAIPADVHRVWVGPSEDGRDRWSRLAAETLAEQLTTTARRRDRELQITTDPTEAEAKMTVQVRAMTSLMAVEGNQRCTITAVLQFWLTDASGAVLSNACIQRSLQLRAEDLETATAAMRRLVGDCCRELVDQLLPRVRTVRVRLAEVGGPLARDAERAVRQGRFQRAMELYLRLADTSPRAMEAVFNAAVLAEKLGKLDSARLLYARIPSQGRLGEAARTAMKRISAVQRTSP